jgi:hypothetical protein
MGPLIEWMDGGGEELPVFVSQPTLFGTARAPESRRLTVMYVAEPITKPSVVSLSDV